MSNQISKDKILELLEALNNKFKKDNAHGELIIYGGAVLCLFSDKRQNTKDIDAIFYPKELFRQYIVEIANEEGLTDDWLNDGVKGFVSKNNDINEYLILSNLDIYTVSPEYLLAMKLMAARIQEPDSHDENDIKILCEALKLTNPNDVFNILLKYYQESEVPPITQYLVESLLS